MTMLTTQSRLGDMFTPPFPQAQRQWYDWFQATRRGQGAVDGVFLPEASKSVPSKFSDSLEFLIFDGVGHLPPDKAPEVSSRP